MSLLHLAARNQLFHAKLFSSTRPAACKMRDSCVTLSNDGLTTQSARICAICDGHLSLPLSFPVDWLTFSMHGETHPLHPWLATHAPTKLCEPARTHASWHTHEYAFDPSKQEPSRRHWRGQKKRKKGSRLPLTWRGEGAWDIFHALLMCQSWLCMCVCVWGGRREVGILPRGRKTNWTSFLYQRNRSTQYLIDNFWAFSSCLTSRRDRPCILLSGLLVSSLFVRGMGNIVRGCKINWTSFLYLRNRSTQCLIDNFQAVSRWTQSSTCTFK